MTYKLLLNPITGQTDKIVLINGDNQTIFGTDIPESSAYQEYLKWLAEGNTPEPADQGE